MWFRFWKQHKKNSYIRWTRFGPQIFCHFALPKFLTTSSLKSCISPVLWSHCRTSCVCSATAGVKSTAQAQTHGYAGQDCTSGRYHAARLPSNAAFTGKQQLQLCGCTLPPPARSNGNVARGRICKLFQPSPWRGVIKPLSRTRAGHNLTSQQALHLLSPSSKVFQCKADFWQQKLFLALFFQPCSAVWGVSRVSANSFETTAP